MIRFIQLTANDAQGSTLLFNVAHIVAVTPEGFSGTTKIMVAGVTFEVKEDFATVSAMLITEKQH